MQCQLDLQFPRCDDYSSFVRQHWIQDIRHFCCDVSAQWLPLFFGLIIHVCANCHTFFSSNAFIFPTVYLFFPETRYRSLEEMDDIFKKSHNIFDVVPNSLNEPYRYDKHGELRPEYLQDVDLFSRAEKADSYPASVTDKGTVEHASS